MPTNRRACLFVSLLAVSGLAMMTPVRALGEESVPRDETSAQVEQLRTLLDSFPARDKPEEENARVREAFFAVDVDLMPPEWRYAFLKKRLWWTQVSGDWEAMLAIRDRLMPSDDPNQPKGQKRSLLEVDLLYQIASYYTSTVFFPPKGSGIDMDKPGEAEAYFREHYQSDQEAEQIYQHIVDHFDLKYAKTADSLHLLAFCQAKQREWDIALENWQRAEDLNLDELYSIDRIDEGQNVSAAKQLEDEMFSLRIAKKMNPQMIINTAINHSNPQVAFESISRLSRKYETDTKIQKEVGEGLRMLLDKIITQDLRDKISTELDRIDRLTTDTETMDK
ncbi:MAG: hypothetical protein V2A74_12290 [bacterium]